MMKMCVMCKVEKKLSEFNKGRSKFGTHAYCRECQRDYSKTKQTVKK